MIIGHSLSQKASIGFPALVPHVYGYIVGYPEDKTALLMIKRVHSILDASTSMLHDLLASFEAYKSDSEIKVVLEANPMSKKQCKLNLLKNFIIIPGSEIVICPGIVGLTITNTKTKILSRHYSRLPNKK